MTLDDIKEVQILAITKDGKHILAKSNEKQLIWHIVSCCQFVKLKDNMFEEHSLQEFIEIGGEK